MLELAFGLDKLGEQLGTGLDPMRPALGQFVPLDWSVGRTRILRIPGRPRLGGGWSAVDLAARELADTTRNRCPHQNTRSIGWLGEASRLL